MARFSCSASFSFVSLSVQKSIL